MNPFLYGFSPAINNSALLKTVDLYKRVGDNSGNLAFCYAIDLQLGGDLKSILWHADTKSVENTGDIGVLTLANQLGPHADMGYLVENFKKLNCPLVGIGLGAQAGHAETVVDIPKGTLEWVRQIQNHSVSESPNIAMRGQFSQAALARYGLAEKTVVTGCPTLFISNDKSLGKTIAKNFNSNLQSIAVTAGHQRWSHLARIEQSLVSMALANNGSYICQSPLEMVTLGRGEVSELSLEARDECRNYIAPYLSDFEFVRWANAHAITFFSTSAWMEYLRRFDFVVGTRIHGVMLALQSGIPALCVAHDSRTIELCKTMKVPYVKAQDVAHGIKRDDINRLFIFDPDEFDKNRMMLLKKYTKFLKDNSLKPAQYLLSLDALQSDSK